MTERPILFSGPMVRALLDGRKTQTRRIVKLQPPAEAVAAGVISSPDPAANARWSWLSDTDLEWAGIVGEDFRCPYGVPGDRLWVKETWADVNLLGAPALAYRADNHIRDLMDEPNWLDDRGAFNYDDPRMAFGKAGLRFCMWSSDLIAGVEGHHWRSPLHMPRWASRLTLQITDVRIERARSIGDDDAIAEGIYFDQIGYTAGHLGGMRGVNQEWSATPPIAFFNLWRAINGLNSLDANPWVWAVSFRVAS